MESRAGSSMPKVAAIALAFLLTTAGWIRADDRASGEASRGALLFKVYCVNCHGETGRGDGPTAEVLVVKPADLTLIRARNGGVFPNEKVYRQIDGRDRLKGHGASRMPIWGLGFQEMDRDTNQEEEVRVKILALIDFLEIIQETEDGKPWPEIE